MTGPIEVRGANVGDRLAVDIERIDLGPRGWLGAHRSSPFLGDADDVASFGMVIAIGDDLSMSGITIPPRPMIGCLGTAPADGPVPSRLVGRHGGNLDHHVVTVGTRVYLPVLVPGGLLFVGDVHAAQGDGELSRIGLEVDAEVTLRISVDPGPPIDWPWARTADRLMILTCGRTFEEARGHAVAGMLRAMSMALGVERSECLALLSVLGDLRIGQACGDLPITLRLEVPSDLAIDPC